MKRLLKVAKGIIMALIHVIIGGEVAVEREEVEKGITHLKKLKLN